MHTYLCEFHVCMHQASTSTNEEEITSDMFSLKRLEICFPKWLEIVTWDLHHYFLGQLKTMSCHLYLSLLAITFLNLHVNLSIVKQGINLFKLLFLKLLICCSIDTVKSFLLNKFVNIQIIAHIKSYTFLKLAEDKITFLTFSSLTFTPSVGIQALGELFLLQNYKPG